MRPIEKNGDTFHLREFDINDGTASILVAFWREFADGINFTVGDSLTLNYIRLTEYNNIRQLSNTQKTTTQVKNCLHAIQNFLRYANNTLYVKCFYVPICE